jgi:hypothetical protein
MPLTVKVKAKGKNGKKRRPIALSQWALLLDTYKWVYLKSGLDLGLAGGFQVGSRHVAEGVGGSGRNLSAP